jgi:ElaB/YqjD/DUF883 family membrane-anchored ribosome-binding protein
MQRKPKAARRGRLSAKASRNPVMHASSHKPQGKGSVAERIAEELQSTKDNLARSASATGDDLAAQIRQLHDDLSTIKETIAAFGQTSRAQAGDAASRIGATAKEAAGDFADSAKKDAQSLLAEFEDYARTNPHYVVGGAIGLGLVLGLFLRRR